jgi:hypothetical protein
MGNTSKATIIMFSLIIQVTIALFCVHFGIISTGGTAINSTMPSSAWSLFTSVPGFFWDSLTFQVGSYYIISVVMWLLAIFELWAFIELVRGD